MQGATWPCETRLPAAPSMNINVYAVYFIYNMFYREGLSKT